MNAPSNGFEMSIEHKPNSVPSAVDLLNQKISQAEQKVSKQAGIRQIQKRIEIRALEAKVLDFRKAGVDARTIADHMEISVPRVHWLLGKAIARLAMRSASVVEDVRELELIRLDEIWLKNIQAFRALKIEVSEAIDPAVAPELWSEEMDKVVDRLNTVTATLLKISERRAMLSGLNRAPAPATAPVPNKAPRVVSIETLKGASEEDLRLLRSIAERADQARTKSLEDKTGNVDSGA